MSQATDVMESSCFELAEGGNLVDLQPGHALARWRAGEGAFWMDVQGFDTAELEALLDELGVTGFLRQGCLRAGKVTAAISLPKGTLAEWAVFSDRACTQRAQFTVLCLRDLLVTMHVEPLEYSEDLPGEIDQLELTQLSTSSVLFAILMQQATMTTHAARGIRDRLLELGERMDRDPAEVELSELESMKREVLLTDAIAEEQQEAFGLIAQLQTDALQLAAKGGPISLLTTTANATHRLIDRLDGRADNLLRRHQDYKHDLTNRRLGLLTIVSAIFLPLTLLAGIWGMNFEGMPELDFPFAYPIALGVMALVAIVGAWVFYKRGWFD